MKQTLGQKIRELREDAELSLRELGKKVGASAAFLSDIELGHRFPSKEVFAKLAKVFHVRLDALQQYDSRQSVADLKRMIEGNPELGFAFRTVVDRINGGKMTVADLTAQIRL